METGDDTVLQIPTMRERETDAGPNGLNQNVTDTRENKLDRILSEYGRRFLGWLSAMRETPARGKSCCRRLCWPSGRRFLISAGMSERTFIYRIAHNRGLSMFGSGSLPTSRSMSCVHHSSQSIHGRTQRNSWNKSIGVPACDLQSNTYQWRTAS